MKITPACRPCLERLIDQAAALATHSAILKEKARDKSLEIIARRYSQTAVSTQIASEVHRVIREITGNPDPYEPMKKREIQMARNISRAIYPGSNHDLSFCINFAVVGNAIDFFLDMETVAQSLSRPLTLAINDMNEVEKLVNKAKIIIYLADNAGECFFDLLLVKHFSARAETTYVVKGSPVQNDITLKDLEIAGLKNEIGKVISTGNDFVGLDLETASTEFRDAFDSADLIVAKGMGYYETITELKGEGRVVFLLKAKCQPVADSLGIPLNSCVVKLY